MINKEYLRRNRLHAASVGVYYGIKSMLERIEQCWSKKPLWLVKALKVELEKAERVHHEMAVHRNETSPTAEAKEASTQPITQAKVSKTQPQGEICPECKGSGRLKSVNVFLAKGAKCLKCNGTGKLPLA